VPKQESTSEAPGGYVGVLGQIVGGLKAQPALLFGLGGGIVLLGLSAAIGGEVWMLVLGIVVVLLAALGAWLVDTRARANVVADELSGPEIEIKRGSTGITREAGREGRAVVKADGKIVVTDHSHGILEREGSGPPPSEPED
jgi:hypothetical protein